MLVILVKYVYLRGEKTHLSSIHMASYRIKQNHRAALNLGPSVLLMASGHGASVLWKGGKKEPREALLEKAPESLLQPSSMLVPAVCESWLLRLSQGRSQDSVLSF